METHRMVSVRSSRMRLRVAVTAAVACWLALSAGPGAEAPREIHVTAKKFEFSPARLEVTQGEAVRIVITSADGKHGFGIKQLDVKTEVPKSGQPAAIEFVAEEVGEFEITCTQWCGKGHKTMKGLLVVKPGVGSQ
jgi:cytochrome c oxidase subunit 2